MTTVQLTTVRRIALWSGQAHSALEEIDPPPDDAAAGAIADAARMLDRVDELLSGVYLADARVAAGRETAPRWRG